MLLIMLYSLFAIVEAIDYVSRSYDLWSWLELVLLRVFEFSSTWSPQRIADLPFVRDPPDGAFLKTFFAGAWSSMRITWPNQRSCCILIRLTSSISSYSSYSSGFILLRYSLFTQIGPKILPRIFLSNVPKIFSSAVDMVHASAPYIGTVIMRVL